MESAPVEKFDARMTGANAYDISAGSDVVVITAGIPRKPGMSRDDLVATNEGIVSDVVRKVLPGSPKAIFIVVSNPLDAMCEVARRVSKLPRERVFGMTEGPVVVAALERADAVAHLRKTMGATDSRKADAGTVRNLYGTDIERNAIHGSDSAENAAKEIAFFFGEAELL